MHLTLISEQSDQGLHCLLILHSDGIFSIFKGNKNVFSLGKIFLSDKKIIPFERYNAPLRAPKLGQVT